ncbi:MAG: sigma-70 family RNA polymerase sigma factor [Chloroflexi bacterium]|nr:sigma-70 family RNA polymerase sigma factor [Chloroflexota bacterium]
MPATRPAVATVDAAIRDASPTIEERDLLDRLRDGDELAFARLFEQHWDGVYRLLAKLLGDADAAADLAQDVFVQLFRLPPETGSAPLRAWLFCVALNRGYNALRSERRRRNREDAVARDPSRGSNRGAIADAALLEEANRADERDAVRRVLIALPERQRDCLILRSEGLSYAEIAAAIGVAPGSVGTLLARAERAFKQRYLAQRGGL